jgi:hypothetical protein
MGEDRALAVRQQHAVELAWACWLVGTIGTFAALETIAYRTQRLPTLSRTLRRWLGVEPRSRWGAISPFVFAAGGASLSWHIARGRFDPL